MNKRILECVDGVMNYHMSHLLWVCGVYIVRCVCIVVTTESLIVQENSTALYLASKEGHLEVVRVLLATNATVNTQNKVSHVNQLYQ